MKRITAAIINSFIFLTTALPVFAHVIVYPHQVGIASTQDFSVSVPNERDNPVTSVRLLLPDGLNSVLTNTEPGWTINTKSSGSGDNPTVTEIDWSAGSIPVGQRAEFIFEAQAPAKETTLNWKAYETYSDGTVVSWDIDPEKMKGLSDAKQDEMTNKENKGEYSTTMVINDLKPTQTQSMQPASQDRITLALSIVAIVFSLGALSIARKK